MREEWGGKEQYTVKKVIVFPVPSRDVTNQTLPGREKFNYSRPGRFWLVTSRQGTGKTITFFLQCGGDSEMVRDGELELCRNKSSTAER
jgi:hypothetical protein